MRLITLTTDFGTTDWFVGTMKGVILGIAPRANIVDLTHEIPRGNIRAGAFALAASCRFFPRGTIHVAVVDPGVGSRRAAIAVQTADYCFIGPDNGVLSLALSNEKIKSIRRLTNEKFFLQPVSATFHGRDIFAPVAAHLCKGTAFRQLGAEQKDFIRLSRPASQQRVGTIQGEVVYIDRFGNVITSISNDSLTPHVGNYVVRCRGRIRCPVKRFYQAVPAGKPVAVPGSSGFLEIAINGGDAARRLGLKVGCGVTIRRS